MAKQNEIIRYPFEVYNASDQPLTGQAGSVVTRLTHNGANASESVTVSEIGSTGRYEATFTPLSLGIYKLTVDKTGIALDTRIEVSDPYNVEVADLDDIVTEVNANETKIDTIDTNVDSIITTLAGLNDITVAEIWDYLTSSILTVGSIGLLLKTNVDQTLSTTESNIITEVDANETKIDTIISNIAALNDITVAEVWDALLTSIVTSGSIGLLIKNNLDQAISTTETNIITEIDANETKIDLIPTVGEINTELSTNHGAGSWEGTISGVIASVVSDAVWDENVSGHNIPNTMGAQLINNQLDLSGFQFALDRLLGLTHENIWQTHTWDGLRHTASTVELYDSKAAANLHDGASGLIASYTLTISYPTSDNRPSSHLMVRDL